MIDPSTDLVKSPSLEEEYESDQECGPATMPVKRWGSPVPAPRDQ